MCAHLLDGQRVVRLDRGVTGHGRRDLVHGLFGGQAAIEALEILGQRAQRAIDVGDAEQDRHRGDPQAGAAEVLEVEAEAGQVAGARQQRRVARPGRSITIGTSSRWLSSVASSSRSRMRS